MKLHKKFYISYLLSRGKYITESINRQINFFWDKFRRNPFHGIFIIKFCDRRNILNLVKIFRISSLIIFVLKILSTFQFSKYKMLINLSLFFLKNQLMVDDGDGGIIKKLFKLLKKHLCTSRMLTVVSFHKCSINIMSSLLSIIS